MYFLTDSPFLNALGWALLHSCWQFALCWLIYRSFIGGTNKVTAAVRHTIALLLLFLGGFSFLASFFWKVFAAPASVTPTLLNISNTPYAIAWNAVSSGLDALMPYWSLLYIGCVVFLVLKFCVFVRHAGRLRNHGTAKMNVIWRTYVKNIAGQLGIQKEVKALLSVHIDTPQVIGFLKPVILLPAACLVNLSTQQLEAVLLHELVHIRRNDYLVNLFVTSLEILFFFNPFVKQLTVAIRKEREYSCDDMVLQYQYHPHHYAAALLSLEKNRTLPVTYGIAASGKNQQQLLKRIERIVGIPAAGRSYIRPLACLLVLLLIGFMATIRPANTVMDALGTDGLLLATHSIAGFDPLEPNAAISNNVKQPAASNKHGATKAATVITVTVPTPPNMPLNEPTIDGLTLTGETYTDEDATANVIRAATHKETFDFSLPQKEMVSVPEAESPEFIPAEPYVPASSFSYQVTQDTIIPKKKGVTYNERMADEALAKTQSAMAQLDWQKIEKQLNYSKRAIAKLKAELANQLKALNWQKINDDRKAQANQEKLDKLVIVSEKQQTLQLYRQTEAYNEAIQRQMAAQDIQLQETRLRAQQSYKAAALKEQKLQQDMKKRRIIAI
ncbi:MAG: M56 family metallopeptidase [Chitinophagaceae bacterium]